MSAAFSLHSTDENVARTAAAVFGRIASCGDHDRGSTFRTARSPARQSRKGSSTTDPRYRAWEQLWRTGRTTDEGLCKPHGEQVLAALATTATDGSIGTANPLLFQDVAPDGS